MEMIERKLSWLFKLTVTKREKVLWSRFDKGTSQIQAILFRASLFPSGMTKYCIQVSCITFRSHLQISHKNNELLYSKNKLHKGVIMESTEVFHYSPITQFLSTFSQHYGLYNVEWNHDYE